MGEIRNLHIRYDRLFFKHDGLGKDQEAGRHLSDVEASLAGGSFDGTWAEAEGIALGGRLAKHPLTVPSSEGMLEMAEEYFPEAMIAPEGSLKARFEIGFR